MVRTLVARAKRGRNDLEHERKKNRADHLESCKGKAKPNRAS